MRPTNEKLAASILKACQKEFLKHGYQDASLREITASLHVSTGAIYRYYTDKKSIFNTLISESTASLVTVPRTAKKFAMQTLEMQLLELPEISQRSAD